MALKYQYEKFMTTRGLGYGYIHITPAPTSSEYILFLHGFPSSSQDWKHQIEFFSKKGYGIVVPDCLGYGKTSKPLNTELYTGKAMAQDVLEILEHEKIKSVIGIGHDWGSYLLSRMVNYHPTVFSQLVFIDIGYSAPGHGLTEQTVRHVNSMVKGAMGFEVFGYFLFFQDKDAAGLLDTHIDSVISLFHTRDEVIGKKYMGAEGGFRTWLEAGMTAPAPSYLSKEDQEYYRQFFSPQNGGFEPSINWYKAQLADLNAKDDADIPKENHILKQPTLLLGGKNYITATADFPNQMKAYAPDLTVEKFDAGHWIMLEKKDEVNEALERFFEK